MKWGNTWVFWGAKRDGCSLLSTSYLAEDLRKDKRGQNQQLGEFSLIAYTWPGTSQARVKKGGNLCGCTEL